jgi:translocation and assembly module TamB
MRKILRIILYILGGIIVLLILIIVLLQTPWGKNLVRQQAVKYLRNKLQTEVLIARLDYVIPDKIALEGVFVRDLRKDTLIHVRNLEVDLDMFALISSKVSVDHLLLEGVNAHIYRYKPDTVFNYNFIVEAFAGTDTASVKAEEKADTASKPLDLDIAKVTLRDIRLRYDDVTGGTIFNLNLGNLLLKPRKIDLEKMRFEIADFSVNRLHAFLGSDTSYLPPEPKDTSAASDFQLVLEKVNLEQIKFSYLDRQDSMFFGINVGLLNARIKEFGLQEQFVDIENFQLEHVYSSMAMGKPGTAQKAAKEIEEATEDSLGTNNWRVKAGNLMLKQIQFVYNDNAQPRQTGGMDYAHMNIRGFSLNGEQVYYSTDTISGNLKHLAFEEQSGLSVIELRTRFLYHPKGARLSNLYLQTPGTLLRDEISVAYPSLAALEKELEKMRMNIGIDKSRVSVDDILLFMQPEQRKMLLPYKGQVLQLTARLNGFLNSLLIQDLYLAGLGATELAVKGKLQGLPDADKLKYDLDIEKLNSTAKDIAPFLTDSIKMQFRIPDWFRLNGRLQGTSQDFYPNMVIKTADGDARVEGSLQMSPGTGKEKYDLQLATSGLNIGRILRMDSVLGSVTLKAFARGTSFDVNSMQTSFGLELMSARAMNYDYHSIQLAGSLKNRLATIIGTSTDPNVRFDLQAQSDLSGKYPSLHAILRMDNVDLQALQLNEDTFKIKGDIFADFTSLNPDYPDGSLVYAAPFITLPGYRLKLDSVIVRSAPTADSAQDIYLNAANILKMNLSGRTPLTQVGNAFIAHINDRYKIADSGFVAPKDYDVQLDAHVNYHPVIKTWMPELKPFDTIKLTASLSPAAMNLDAYIPRIIYGKNRLDSGVVKVYEAGDTLRYALSLKKYEQDQLQFWYPSVRGGLRNDSIYTRIALQDSTQKDQFALGGAIYHDLESDSSLTYIRMFRGLLLDYERWDVNPNNRIVLGPGGFYIRDFAMVKGAESITASSRMPDFKSPLDIKIQNFSLSNITRVISRDTLLADGSLNVNAMIDMSDSAVNFNADASVKNLTAFNEPIGDLELNAKSETHDVYNATLRLSGNENDIVLAGNYYLNPRDSNEFRLRLNMNALSLKSVQGLTFGAIKNSSGFLRGDLDITGSAAKPRILGTLRTDQLTTTVSMLNTAFSMPSESIDFNRDGIALNNFTIKDRNGRDAIIDGTVRTRDYSRYRLNLNVKTNRWQAINATKKDNELFYGKLFFSSNLNVTGMATAPKIDGTLNIHDSTNITYAMIDNGPGIQESDGVVRFVDSRDTSWVDSTQLVTARGMRMSRAAQLNVNVDIEKAATFNVVIDPVTGDNLRVKGDAHLNAFIGPDGAVGLTGMYELADGYYELNYNFLKRKFKIKPGSTITLSGDPLDAEVDITAVYTANVAPYELMQKQSDPDQMNFYKQRMPFDVQLKLKGKVMQPDISFDIVLPEDKMTMVRSDVADEVQRKLREIRNDPSTLNKQVFAVLILGRFIADDPFASGPGGGMEYAARQSASRFLSDQLNNLAGQLVQGFDLNVGLESSEDYSTGQKSNRTDLNVSASKRLFSDRLNITVGNDFQLEGQQAQSQQSSLIPGNLSAEYRLSKDGRYMVRAYRVNQLQNIIDGYVIETGVSFRITIDYNRFKYIFRNREKMRKQREERARKAADEQSGSTGEQNGIAPDQDNIEQKKNNNKN